METDYKPASKYNRDYTVSNIVEDWIVESGVKMKFNTITYYFETIPVYPKTLWDHLLQSIGVRKKKTKLIMHIVTNVPGYLIGRAGNIIDRYRSRLIDVVPDLDDIQLHEVKSPEDLWKRVKRKIKARDEKVEE